ncbi:MAG: ABC transporter permease [Polyangiaceae bacterium]|nr:ABC transporter permease [Polyangiaceae bacterium]
MQGALLIASRELKGFLRSPLAYVVIAIMLLVDGLLYYGTSLGGEARVSADVLFNFFYFSSGTTMAAAILLSMRLFAEEKQTGTFTLLNTAPVRETSIVAGKFISAYVLVAGLTLLTVYLPLLIFINGRVSVGHIVVGYLGLLLLGAAATAIGTFGSVLVKSQTVAAVVSAVILVSMLVLWMVAKETDPPINEFLVGLSLHDIRFRPFMQGQLELQNCVYYLAVTFFFLVATTKTLEARRWR